MGANLEVILEGQVGVWMRAGAVDSDLLPLGRRSRVFRHGSLAVLHLDGVKRWGGDGPGFEPHRAGRWAGQTGAGGCRTTQNMEKKQRE